MHFIQDIGYSLRVVRRNLTFSVVIVLSLAFAIGANTAIFSLLYAVLLRPLPYSGADRLAIVWEDNSRFGFPRNLTSPANYKDWMTLNSSFEQMAATRGRTFNLTGDGEPEEVDAVGASANLFSTLGAKPILGRGFEERDDQPGVRVALVSFELWQRRYGSDPGLISRQINLDEEPYEVIGVMPRGFDYPESGTKLWIPLALTPSDWSRRTSHFLRVVGRLKPQASLQQAQADMNVLAESLGQQYPDSQAGIVVVDLREQLVGKMRPRLLLLMIGIGCVLLIACTNTANLMLVRSARRRRDIGMRLALGASGSEIVRLVLTESGVIAFLSGILGWLLAPLSFDLLKTFIPADMATSTQLKLDLTALGFSAIVCLLTALLFGIVPAMQAKKVNLIDVLKQGGYSTVGAGSRRLQKVLVVLQVSLALLLVIGAGLLFRTYVKLQSLPLGFNPEGVLTVRTSTSGAKKSPVQKGAFLQGVLERVRALPGVESAGYVTYLPLTTTGVAKGFFIEGRPQPGQGEVPFALFRTVSEGYFETMKIPLIKGRYVEKTDGPTENVAVINEAMAAAYWPDEDPIGRRVVIPSLAPPEPQTIVGVVKNVRETGVNAEYRPAMYLSYIPLSQPNSFPADLAIRAQGDLTKLMTAVRNEISGADRSQPISRLTTMEGLVDSQLEERKVNMWLLGLFAALAIIQASLGLYGLLANLVAQQTRDIGVRMALGASPRTILRSVVGEGMGLTVLGIAIGLGASIALSTVISSLLFNVSTSDPSTLVLSSAVLIVIAFFAAYIPARRAMKIDPMEALRIE